MNAEQIDFVREKVQESVHTTLRQYAEALMNSGYDGVSISVAMAEGLIPLVASMYAAAIDAARGGSGVSTDADDSLFDPANEMAEKYRELMKEALNEEVE